MRVPASPLGADASDVPQRTGETRIVAAKAGMRESPERRRDRAEVTWQASNFYTRLDLSDEAGHSSSRQEGTS
jgi:hypothetical protein